MHENFSLDENDVTWVDEVFRKSLAIIQAESSRENEYISLLQARTKALLKKVPDKSSRQKIIASGIPLSVSQKMLDSVEDFRTLALSFTSQSTADEQIDQINNIVREIEIWSNLNAEHLIENMPEQDSRVIAEPLCQLLVDDADFFPVDRRCIAVILPPVVQLPEQ